MWLLRKSECVITKTIKTFTYGYVNFVDNVCYKTQLILHDSLPVLLASSSGRTSRPVRDKPKQAGI